MRRPLLFVCVCLFGITAFFMQLCSPPPWNSKLAVSVGEEVVFCGQVYQKEYRVRYGEELVLLYLQIESFSKEADAFYQKRNHFTNHFSLDYPESKVIFEICISELPKGADGSVYVPRLGEEILVSGYWQEFAHATNPGEFDLADYYAVEGIAGSIGEGKIVAGSEGYWWLREKLFGLRQRLLRNLYTAFEPKEASILAKMLLGDGSGLDKEVRELYQENGIVHILSISGLHISMLGMGVYYLLRRCKCPVRGAAIWGGILIVLYGMLTGFGVSACRAIGMYLIHMLGEIWGKTYDMLTAMGVLAIVLLWQNPRLVYHSGYLLSFASVCGVGVLAPRLKVSLAFLRVKPYDSMIQRICKKRMEQTIDGLGVSLSVTLFTLPIQLFFFYKIPIYSVLLNLLVIPFVSVVMVIGLVGMLLPFLPFLCTVESLIFAWFEWLCHIFERLPGHTWVTGRPAMWRILVYYAVLMLFVCGRVWQSEDRWKILCGRAPRRYIVMGGLVGILLLIGNKGSCNTRMVFLDVGQGDCICLLTKEGNCYLFDGGSSNKNNVGEQIIIPFLLFNGVSQVDGVFVSHPDADHTNGLEALLEENAISIERFILPAVADADLEELCIMVREYKGTRGKNRGMQVEYASKGDAVKCEETTIFCLHPEAGMHGESNTYSACYMVETEGVSVLLTADVETVGENMLTRELKKRGIKFVDVLKVAHHGSKYSTSEEFLAQIDIQWAVISCGVKNSYGHPHMETLERLEQEGGIILTTAKSGAINVEIKKDEIEVSTFY